MCLYEINFRSPGFPTIEIDKYWRHADIPWVCFKPGLPSGGLNHGAQAAIRMD